MVNNDNNNYLFDLIQDLQAKLSNENSSNLKEEKTNSNYVQESMFNNDNNKTNNLNFESLFENLGQGFDINTLFKMQKIFSSLNKDDPRKNLLISLKPFLKKSRQEKLDEYLMYLTIGSALGIFEDKGSGEND